MQIKKGVDLLEESPGDGPVVEHGRCYRLALRLTLSRGDVVKSPDRCLPHALDGAGVDEDGFFTHRIRMRRGDLVAGIVYALEGMRVGGSRKVVIAPHLAYGEAGVPGVIPPNALLTADIKVIEAL